MTLGGYVTAQPDYEGSDDYEAGFKPIFNIRQEGSKEWLSLPDDAGGFALYSTSNFRIGPAFSFIESRDSSDNKALHGLRDVDWTIEAGAFIEYWPRDWLRTRVELLQGLNGGEGFVANLSADGVWRPSEKWQFTLGPRLQFVNDQYNDTYFSIDAKESARSGLRQFDADGGLHSVGAGFSATYNWTPRFATKFFAEYDRLLGDAADSPIVDDRGSADQVTVGIGASYTFEFRR